MANILFVEAACMETASRRGVDWTGHIAGQNDSLLLPFWIRNGSCREKGLSVGVEGGFVETSGVRKFHNLT